MTSRKLPIPQGGRRRMRTYLSTVLDNFSRYIIAWKLCTTMKADDVTASHIAGYRVMSLRRTVNCASTLGVLGWETVIAPNADLQHVAEAQILSLHVANRADQPAAFLNDQVRVVKPSEVPVFILCGGLGTRLREETEVRPKPMVPVGNHPILWHIMRTYSHYGFKNFVLCLGYKADVIKSYFLNYPTMNSDFTIELKTNDIKVHKIDHEQDWTVTLADTGELTMTGARVARAAAKYLGNAEHFAVTYGDGVTDADLADALDFHLAQGKIGTVLGVNPPSRFGELKLDHDEVVEFAEKPEFADNWINGGYFFFKRDILRYLNAEEGCVLEREPLIKLARDHQLSIRKHRGFWYAMDTQRDREYLNKLWDSGQAAWRPK